MKNILFVLVACLLSVSAMAALSVDGTYQGKNLYVQNPMDDEGFGYCATKVTVNGDIMPGGTSMGAFEIDFSMFNIEIGEPVFIVIEHNDGCKPKILNPEVLLPRSTFDVKEMNVSDDGRFAWKTTGEQGKLPFVIEQYRWNKWVAVGEVEGKGSGGENAYVFQVSPHSGENTVRIVQTDHSGTKRPSDEKKFISSSPVVIKTPAKVKNEIKFLANSSAIETRYEIYDAYGNIVKKGVGSSVNCSNLLRGVYYINFDNVNEKFIKN
ncbi:MAG: T9SS type A sorting domain-containing protein [Crocinitomicaceae bacterium]|nr:T9SS type A sorting domain-containing protein [Crocinitomicaceae bacterium]